MNDLSNIITIAGNLGGAVIIGLAVVWVFSRAIDKFADVRDKTLTAFREELQRERDGGERRHTAIIALIEKTHDEKMEAHNASRIQIEQVQKTVESLTVRGYPKHA